MPAALSGAGVAAQGRWFQALWLVAYGASTITCPYIQGCGVQM